MTCSFAKDYGAPKRSGAASHAEHPSRRSRLTATSTNEVMGFQETRYFTTAGSTMEADCFINAPSSNVSLKPMCFK